MIQPVLSDPNIFPADAILASHLGKTKASFDALFKYNHADFPDFVEKWKYYNDGKSWLMNVSRKKKTPFWLSAGDGFFRVAFYFGTKAENAILDSSIPDEYKNQFMESAGKKFRSIVVVIKKKKDIEVYKKLLPLKMAFQ